MRKNLKFPKKNIKKKLKNFEFFHHFLLKHLLSIRKGITIKVKLN